ncbi:uncharacterized protein DEA37_0013887 [Paragonimus westermani]|uniref:SH3 domain-binding protein 5 n=1 Tax=Paragonimus westermani TaxID=34504 RepID=A0A5J4NIA2_9TREM|nr:uncharacterized protein DEA37_0013887 [Paragonimus westermani]
MEEPCLYDQLPYSKRQEVEVGLIIGYQLVCFKVQLDVLNQTAPQINVLENKLLEARANYHATLTDNSDKLKALGNRLGKCVQRARPYYEARQRQYELIQLIRIAVERYNKANDVFSASRENFSRLETINHEAGKTGNPEALDAINRCIAQVNSARQEVVASKTDHERLLDDYNESERAIHLLERRHKLDIKKARPYFVSKQIFDQRMQDAKLHVEVCTQKVNLCKSVYAEAMKKLEHISESLHLIRQSLPELTAVAKFVGEKSAESSPPLIRGQGVGAESSDCLNEIAPQSTSVLATTSFSRGFFKTDPSCCDPSPTRCELHFSSPDSRRNSEPSAVPLVDGLLHHVQRTEAELGTFSVSTTAFTKVCDSVNASVSYTHPSSHCSPRSTLSSIACSSIETVESISTNQLTSVSVEPLIDSLHVHPSHLSPSSDSGRSVGNSTSWCASLGRTCSIERTVISHVASLSLSR